MKIWKFPLAVVSEQKITPPRGARPLHVGTDPGGVVCVWMLVSPDEPPVERRVRIYGTGHTIDDVVGTDAFPHVGSCVQDAFVWHVFMSP